MKKILCVGIVAALLMGLCGCGGMVSILPGAQTPVTGASAAEGPAGVFSEQPLLDFMGMGDFSSRYYADTPAALSYRPQIGESTGCRSYVFDRASIIAFCDALRGVTVTGPAAAAPVTSAEYILTMSDGQEYPFVFVELEGGDFALSVDGALYAVTGTGGLFEIDFPVYSDSYDVFDLYFSDDVRAFADGFSAEPAVSVGLRTNTGVTLTSSDPDVIEAVFRALAATTVIVTEDEPDLHVDVSQVREYIFTMKDGTAFRFSFAQRCLAVTANADFGPVYYWLDGTDELWNVQIVADDDEALFAGGTVADLREDIAAAAQAAAGEEEDAIAGVFVEYTIDDESGYLTLSGSTARDFVARICSVPVTGEAVTDTAGAVITASVTLADGSGPIVYFIGDAVQQYVGTCYACDGDAMQQLRAQVLSLAADGNNTAQIEEGGTE